MTDLKDAMKLFDAGDHAGAERLCRETLAVEPDNPIALYVLGAVCYIGKRSDEARALLERVVAKGTHIWQAFSILGSLYQDAGEWDNAVMCFDASARIRARRQPAAAGAASANPEVDHQSLVSIVTPTVGTPFLSQAANSVQAQTYRWIEHLVVVDGPKSEARVRPMLPAAPRHPVYVLTLPYNLGGGGFNGHRVYGAAPYLARGRYVCFLDEDNWFEPEHVASMAEAVAARRLAWSYSLRNVVDADGRFMYRDDCQSLGRWPTWHDGNRHLVDTNCYLIRRGVAMQVSTKWYRTKSGEIYGPDFGVCHALLEKFPRCDTTGLYTVNYRLRGAQADIRNNLISRGNAEMARRYPDGFPWEARSRAEAAGS